MNKVHLIEKVLQNPRTDNDTLRVAAGVKELYEEVTALRAELEEIKEQIKPPNSGLIDILEIYSHRLLGWQNSKDLYRYCCEIAEKEGISFPFNSARALGNKLHRSWSDLVEELHCQKRKGKNNETLYYFPRT